MQLVLLFLAIIPVAIIMTYVYRKDKNKEPGSLLVTLFIMGIISCFMVLAVSDVMSIIFPFMDKGTEHMTFFEVMGYAFVGVALVEEFCKFFMTYLFSYKNKAYDEVYDGIVYAVFVSLGFAFFENILYVFTNQSVTVGIARGLLAVPGHACDAVFMGYYLSVAKVYSQQGKKELERKNIVLSILAPTILHGIYDFCLFTGQLVFMILFLIFVVFLYIGSLKKIKQLAGPNNKQQNQYQNNNLQYNNQINNNSQNNSQGFTPQTAPTTFEAMPSFSNPVLNPAGGYPQVATQPNNSNTAMDYFQRNMPTPQTVGYVQNNNSQPNGYINMNNQPVNRFCPSCGNQVDGEFCGKCGSRQS